jgi:hypothetical protein
MSGADAIRDTRPADGGKDEDPASRCSWLRADVLDGRPATLPNGTAGVKSIPALVLGQGRSEDEA